MSAPPSDEQQQHVRSIARHSVIYSVAPILQKAINILLIGLYTTRLNEAQWGVSQMIDLLIVATTQLAGVNLMSAMVRFYFDHERAEDRAAVITSATLFLVGVAGALAAIGVLFRHQVVDALFVAADPKLAGDNLPLCLIVALALIPLGLCSEAGMRYLQIHRRSAAISTLQVCKTLLAIGLKIWMILVLGLGVLGFLLPVLIGELLVAVFLTGSIMLRLRPRFDWRILRPMLIYTLPLVPVGFCQMGLHQIDRLLLRQLGPDGVAMSWTGVYGLGYQVGILVQYVVIGSFMQIWQPYIFNVKDAEQRARYLVRVSTLAFLLVASASLALITFGRELVFFLSGQEGYKHAYKVVPWVTGGYVFFGLNGLAQVPLLIAKRTMPMLWINLTALVINVGLNVVLIQALGFVGAAIATCITFVCLASMGLIAARFVGNTRFDLLSIASIACVVLAFAGSVLWIDGFSTTQEPMLTWRIVPKAVLLLTVLAGFWLTVLRRAERDQIVNWLLTNFRRRILRR